MSKEVETECRDWSSLPVDILELIVSKICIGNNVANFRVVCKQWCRTYYPKDIGFDSQWLVQTESEFSLRLYHPLIDKPLIIDLDDELHGAFPVCAKEGWILFKGYKEMFFLNPFSHSIINLPHLPFHVDRELIRFSFTSTPNSKDCSVFAVTDTSECFTSIFTLARGENSWRKNIVSYGGCSFYLHPTSPLYLAQRLYYMNYSGIVGIFNSIGLSEKNMLPRNFSYKFKEVEIHGQNYYLLDFNGKLLVVHLARVEATVTICEWDESNLMWQNVDDLGEYTLFLSDTTNSFARRSTRTCMKNKIFFSKFRENWIVFYSLEHRLFGTFENDLPIMDFVRIREFRDCCWMEPAKNHKSSRILWDEGNETESKDDQDKDGTDSTISSELDDDYDYREYFWDLDSDFYDSGMDGDYGRKYLG